MTLPKFSQALLILIVGTFTVNAQEKAVEVLTDRSIDWKQPEARLKAALRVREIESRNYQKAKALAKSLGKPVTENLPGGKIRWLDGLDENGELLYHETRNINAAISTGADKVNSSPYNVDGSGLRIGVWENSSPRVTHQEFMETGTSRINNVQSLGYGDHATHVAGTIAAFGVNPSAKGMAFKSSIDAYRAGNDESYMPVAGAVSAGQLDSRVYVSNHSYGPSYGWEVLSGEWTWKGEGTDENAADHEFGQYSVTSRSIDSICYNTPYYLPFWASGNERVNGPSNGTISRIGGIDVAYNSAIHPAYDNNYRNGYETMGDETISKNVVTVGAAKDAVTSGVRDPSKADIAFFSSTGPTDDGRIKPDLVGNGTSVFSTYNGGDTSYSTLQGTSMATPNVVGTAGLPVFGPNNKLAVSISPTVLYDVVDRAGAEGNPATVRSKLDGIGQDVKQDLLEFSFIGIYQVRQGGQFAAELNVMIEGLFFDKVQTIDQKHIQVEGRQIQVHFAGFNLR